MRAFVALELPGEFADDVAALARQLEHVIDGRYMRRDTYHLTLAFLGEIDQREVLDVMDVMDSLSELSEPLQPVRLHPSGLGKFGRGSDATLWLGIQPVPELELLVGRLRNGLRERGIYFDSKPFRAHITLARRAHIPRAGMPVLPFPQDGLAKQVTLFKSVLSKEGATYKVLHTVELG